MKACVMHLLSPTLSACDEGISSSIADCACIHATKISTKLSLMLFEGVLCWLLHLEYHLVLRAMGAGCTADAYIFFYYYYLPLLHHCYKWLQSCWWWRRWLWQLWRLQCWWPSDNHYRLLSSFLLVTRWRQAIIIQWFIIHFPIFNLNFFLVVFTIPFVGPKHVLKLRTNRQTYRVLETLQVLSAPWS